MLEFAAIPRGAHHGFPKDTGSHFPGDDGNGVYRARRNTGPFAVSTEKRHFVTRASISDRKPRVMLQPSRVDTDFLWTTCPRILRFNCALLESERDQNSEVSPLGNFPLLVSFRNNFNV